MHTTVVKGISQREKHHFVTGAARTRTEVTSEDHEHTHPHTCYTTVRLLKRKYQLILSGVTFRLRRKYCHGAPSLPEGTHGSPAHHVEIFVLSFFFLRGGCLWVCLPASFVYLPKPSCQEKSFSKTNVFIYMPGVCLPSRAQQKARAVIAYLWRWSSEEMRNDFDEEGWRSGQCWWWWANPSTLVPGLIFQHDRKLC